MQQIMKTLNLPSFPYKTRQRETQTDIFDSLRKKYVRLTPEEWVRQHIIHYLIYYRHYPSALISIERPIRQKDKGSPRADILVYGKKCVPIMVIECKAPHKKLSKNTLQQMIQYNKEKIPFLVFTNGLQHFCFSTHRNKKHYVLLKEMPSFVEVQQNQNYVSL